MIPSAVKNARTVTSFKLGFKKHRKDMVSTTQRWIGEWSQDGDVENSARRTLPERPQRSHWKFNTKYTSKYTNIFTGQFLRKADILGLVSLQIIGQCPHPSSSFHLGQLTKLSDCDGGRVGPGHQLLPDHGHSLLGKDSPPLNQILPLAPCEENFKKS